jgi:hypothetical protein
LGDLNHSDISYEINCPWEDCQKVRRQFVLELVNKLEGAFRVLVKSRYRNREFWELPLKLFDMSVKRVVD